MPANSQGGRQAHGRRRHCGGQRTPQVSGQQQRCTLRGRGREPSASPDIILAARLSLNDLPGLQGPVRTLHSGVEERLLSDRLGVMASGLPPDQNGAAAPGQDNARPAHSAVQRAGTPPTTSPTIPE